MFEESLQNIGSNRYLGSGEVVDKLVRQFVHDVLTAESAESVYSAVNRMAEIFSGADKSFQSIDDWTGKAGLNCELAMRLHINFNQSDGDILRSAFGIFAQYLFDIVKREAGEEEIDLLILYIDSLMLGTAETQYPNARFWYEGPVDGGEDLAKAHNPGYTRKDGTVVKPFDDSRTTAKPEKEPEENKYPDAKDHPSLNDNGDPVSIHHPSQESDPETWSDPAAVAVFIPGGNVPSELNGIPVSPWTDHPQDDEWDDVEGQIDLEEPTMNVPEDMDVATGVVIEEPDGRIWLVSPTNAFGGYKATYPKGRHEDDLSFQANAIKEAFEETGLKVEITGYIGDFERTTTLTRMYRGRRVGGSPVDIGWETQAVQLVPKSKLEYIAANKTDLPIHELVKKM